MRELGWFLLGFVVGAVTGWAAVIAAYAAYVEVFNVFDRDGGGAMAAVFAIGPMVGLITGLVTGVQVALRRKRRTHAEANGAPPRRWPGWARALVGTVLPGGAAYFAVGFVFWLLGPLRFESWWSAFAVSLLPLAAGLTAAALGLRVALRRPAVG